MTSSNPSVVINRRRLQIGPEMVFEHIEKLQQEYTDKYVTVDEGRPELRRFSGMTGTVRTVNMSGRALVEFDANLNTGWYDIDIDFLKVIDAPLPKPETKKPAAKAKAKTSPKTTAAAKKSAAPSKPAAGGAMSVADMLAAARGGGAAAPAAAASSGKVAEVMESARRSKGESAAPAKVDAKSMSVADMLAAARGGSAPAAAAPAPPAKVDAKSMSVADMLAAARGGAAPAPDDSKAKVQETLEAARTSKVEAVVADEPAAEEAAVEEEAAAESGLRRDDITAVDEQVAYCRNVDAG